MPRAAWSKTDERQYAHILKSCRRSDRRRSASTCKRIAASTVNKHRKAEGRTLSGFDAEDKETLTLLGAIGFVLFAAGYAVGKS
jgi:hypothetical protein